MIRVVDTRKDAAKMYRTFNDREHSREQAVSWKWPTAMQEIGKGRAEMYSSNKWQKNLDRYEDYKHIAEGWRFVYAERGFIRERNTPSRKVPVFGPTLYPEGPMPAHFVRLAPLIGIQVRLYQKAEDGSLYLPKGDDDIYEVNVAHAFLGGARHPETKEPFLFVYTKHGVHMLLTGPKLAVQKDGIVG